MIPQYIGCDTETGHLYSATGALLAIAARAEWCRHRPFLVYIDPASQPGKVVTAEAARKNGYTPGRWAERGQVTLEKAMVEFREWIEWMRREKKEGGPARFLCHNLAFDRSFLQEAERITGIELPGRHDWRCSMVKFGDLMDTGVIEGGSASLDRLGDLSGYWETDPRGPVHEPLQDVDACLDGMRWLWERHLAHCVYGVSDGLDAIFHERIRQVTQEGWTAENDDRYINGELRDAAIAYAMVCDDRAGETAMESPWPWDPEWWKPVDDPVRNLTKAGALIAAEIDRLSRRKEGQL